MPVNDDAGLEREADRMSEEWGVKMEKWLSEEEQYQEILNNEQIARIKDPVLRQIRERHWKYRTRIFLDENNISDEMLEQLTEEDVLKEKREIKQYKLNKPSELRDG